MGPRVEAGTWLFMSGASTTKDALNLCGVEWGIALASDSFGGMVVDSLGVAGWFGAVGACADSPAPGVCWFGSVFNVGDPLAAPPPLPLPFPLPPPAPLPLPV